MHFAASAVVFGSVATMAAAVASSHFEDHHHHHDDVPTEPRHHCHANCGQTIRISRSPKGGYCKDETWKKRFDDCLHCALKFDIWDYYSTGVGSAAGKCGLDATPKPVDGGASSKAESATAAASTTAVVTSAAPSQTSASSVSTAVEHATSVSSRRHDPDHHHDPAPHASAMSTPIEQTTSESSHHHVPAPHASPISTPIEQTTSESSHHHVPAPHASAATGASAVASAPTTAAGELNSTATGAAIFTAGSSKNILSGLAVAGVAALVAVGLF